MVGGVSRGLHSSQAWCRAVLGNCDRLGGETPLGMVCKSAWMCLSNLGAIHGGYLREPHHTRIIDSLALEVQGDEWSVTMLAVDAHP